MPLARPLGGFIYGRLPEVEVRVAWSSRAQARFAPTQHVAVQQEKRAIGPGSKGGLDHDADLRLLLVARLIRGQALAGR
jgi:hypothetical protein